VLLGLFRPVRFRLGAALSRRMRRFQFKLTRIIDTRGTP
jgi:hypothetical protein